MLSLDMGEGRSEGMSQLEFLIRTSRNRPIRQVEKLSAFYMQGKTYIGKTGPFPTYQANGIYSHGKVEIWTKTDAVSSVPLTAEGVRAVVRRLRPQEAERLDALDAEEQRLRERRKELMAEAWAKGHVVTVAEVRALADAALARRKKGVQA